MSGLKKRWLIMLLFTTCFGLQGCQSSPEEFASDVKPTYNPVYSSSDGYNEAAADNKNFPPKPDAIDRIHDPYALFKRNSSSEMKIFTNKIYGYTMGLPKSWGTIYSYSGNYNEEINDEWEIIGPYLPDIDFNKDPNINFEIFFSTDPEKNKNQSWTDFYIKERLGGEKYDISDWDGIYPTKLVYLLDEEGKYKRACLLLEHTNLYAFCFDPQNKIAMSMVDSIRFDK